MKKNEKFYAWWLSRNVYFKRYDSVRKVYVFEDICDAVFWLTEEQVSKLIKK